MPKLLTWLPQACHISGKEHPTRTPLSTSAKRHCRGSHLWRNTCRRRRNPSSSRLRTEQRQPSTRSRMSSINCKRHRLPSLPKSLRWLRKWPSRRTRNGENVVFTPSLVAGSTASRPVTACRGTWPSSSSTGSTARSPDDGRWTRLTLCCLEEGSMPI